MDNLNLARIARMNLDAVDDAWAFGVSFVRVFIDAHGTLYSGERVSYK